MNEQSSIETPLPAAFLPYDQNAVALKYDEPSKSDNDEESNDDYSNVRHGRSPRFYWILSAVALVVLVACIGTGVGVAKQNKDNISNSNESTYTESNAAESESTGSIDDTRSDKTTSKAGDQTVELEAEGNYGFGLEPEGTASNNKNNDSDSSNSPASATPVPTSEVFDIILSHARYHGVEFNDPNSYQSLAARWVEDTAQLGVHSPQRLVQRYVLACIYYATNGVPNAHTELVFGAGNPVRTWIDESGWLVDDDECTWYRITCNDNKEVTKIELHENRLTGQMPAETALLKNSLQVMDLYSNMIHNQDGEGNDWLGELHQLTNLYYGKTNFEYNGIPTAIGRLTNLVEYDCSYTLYYGPLQGQVFSKLSNLEYLSIGGNMYNSGLPSELVQLPKLQFLYSEFTDLTGDLSFVGSMPAVIELWVDKNPLLQGGLPSEIGFATTLKSFSVTNCSLTGTIPTELGSLGLQQAWFFGNDLQGSMPQSMCDVVYPNGQLIELQADCDTDSWTCSCCTECGGPDGGSN